MKVLAKARHVHMAPRKLRLVTALIRGRDISSARQQLRVSKKAAADVVLKVLDSAVANAIHNFHLKTDALRIASATVDGGPIIHRFRPRAMGRAAPIRKRTSHVTVIVEDKDHA